MARSAWDVATRINPRYVRQVSTCSHCGQHKGKRRCPALAGAICSRCCGRHRLVEIACPSDCVHLGGLAVVREAAVALPSYTFDDDDDDDPDAGWSYDANTAPDPEVWLATDESLKLAAIEAHHRALAVDLPNPRLHAAIHAIVENQLAADAPAESRATLERFVAAGVTRHDAVHAIGSVVAGTLWRVLRRNASVDQDAMIAALARLDPSDWRGGEP